MRVKFQRVLCATDFSDLANWTIPYGIALARLFGARLYLCHVVEMRTASMYHADTVMDPMDMHQGQVEYAQQQFQHWLGDAEIKWEALIPLGYPSDEIARLVEKHQIDLVIAATHGRSGWRRLLLGSVAERLMHTLSIPLLIVRADEGLRMLPGDEPLRLTRILVGCDFSAHSQVALAHALSLAQEFEAQLHLVHVAPAGAAGDAQSEASDLQRIEHHEAEQRLMDLLPAEAAHWCQPKAVVLSGRPHEQLVAYAANERMDLVVMGVRGMGLLGSLLVGSNTDRVVRQSVCPLLAVGAAPEEQSVVRGTTFTEQSLDVHHHYFSARSHGDVVCLHLEKELLVHLADLGARDALFDYLKRVAENEAVKSLVLIGSPEKAGVKEYRDFFHPVMKSRADRNSVPRLLNALNQFLLRMESFPKITIYVDSGPVLFLYLGLGLVCDYRLVSETTVFQNACLELDLLPKGGMAFYLPRRIGYQPALELLLLESEIKAERAAMLGIVDRVVPEQALEQEALNIAARFSDLPAGCIAGTKRLLNDSQRAFRAYLELENLQLINRIGSTHTGN